MSKEYIYGKSIDFHTTLEAKCLQEKLETITYNIATNLYSLVDWSLDIDVVTNKCKFIY